MTDFITKITLPPHPVWLGYVETLSQSLSGVRNTLLRLQGELRVCNYYLRHGGSQYSTKEKCIKKAIQLRGQIRKLILVRNDLKKLIEKRQN